MPATLSAHVNIENNTPQSDALTRRAMRAYALGCIPLFAIYMFATETDGDWSRGFNLISALKGSTRNMGPAVLLLLLVWPYTGWMERRGFSQARTITNHVGMAIAFSGIWHVCVFLTTWLFFGEEAALRARKNWFIWQSMWGMMIYASVAGGFSALRAIERARTQAAAAAQAETLLARTELAALRNKLNPHFLFNTLHSLIALVRKDARTAESALLQFSDMLRYVLETEKSGSEMVTLADELDFTRDYLALEALRLGDRLNVAWSVDESLRHVAVPALTIQPLVENSIKHAFGPRSRPGVLTIAVVRAGERVAITVKDDGPGTDPQQVSASSGLGIRTVARRLALLHGERASLRIETASNAGFAVHLQLPLTALESSMTP